MLVFGARKLDRGLIVLALGASVSVEAPSLSASFFRFLPFLPPSVADSGALAGNPNRVDWRALSFFPLPTSPLCSSTRSKNAAGFFTPDCLGAGFRETKGFVEAGDLVAPSESPSLRRGGFLANGFVASRKVWLNIGAAIWPER